MQKFQLKPLKGKKSFSRVFETGRRFFEGDAAAVVCFGREFSADNENLPDSEIRTFYYAVSVRKKTAKKAVVRNRIKRLLRVSLKRVMVESAKKDVLPAFEFIFINWRNAPSHPMLIGLKDVLPSVHSIIEKAGRYGLGLASRHENREKQP